MTTAVEKLKEFRSRRDDLEKQIRDESKVLFKEASADIFDKYPALMGFTWRQYTPYFADGDECIFGAQTDCIDLRIVDELGVLHEEDEFSDTDLYDYSGGYKNKKLKDPLGPRELAGRDVLQFLATFEDKDFKDMFGDHVRVTVTRDGVETEDYEHD